MAAFIVPIRIPSSGLVVAPIAHYHNYPRYVYICGKSHSTCVKFWCICGSLINLALDGRELSDETGTASPNHSESPIRRRDYRSIDDAGTAA